MFGLIWLIHVVLIVRVPAPLPVLRFWHGVVYKEELALIRSHDLGLVVPVSGVKIIMRYPVDSSYFSSTKLKIKFEGDDYVLGETMIGWLGTIAYTRAKSKTKVKNNIAANE